MFTWTNVLCTPSSTWPGIEFEAMTSIGRLHLERATHMMMYAGSSPTGDYGVKICVVLLSKGCKINEWLQKYYTFHVNETTHGSWYAGQWDVLCEMYWYSCKQPHLLHWRPIPHPPFTLLHSSHFTSQIL